MLFLTRRNVQSKTARGTTISYSQLGQIWYKRYVVPDRDRIINNEIEKQLTILEMESLVHGP